MAACISPFVFSQAGATKRPFAENRQKQGFPELMSMDTSGTQSAGRRIAFRPEELRQVYRRSGECGGVSRLQVLTLAIRP
jgi:hypothetical protein